MAEEAPTYQRGVIDQVTPSYSWTCMFFSISAPKVTLTAVNSSILSPSSHILHSLVVRGWTDYPERRIWVPKQNEAWKSGLQCRYATPCYPLFTTLHNLHQSLFKLYLPPLSPLATPYSPLIVSHNLHLTRILSSLTAHPPSERSKHPITHSLHTVFSHAQLQQFLTTITAFTQITFLIVLP